jgi:hypothetical protein
MALSKLSDTVVGARHNFFSEIRIMAKLRHPYVTVRATRSLKAGLLAVTAHAVLLATLSVTTVARPCWGLCSIRTSPCW